MNLKTGLLSLLTAAPILAWGAAEPPLKIVATTSDLADIAARLAGPEAVVRAICKGTEDPHFLNARPGYVVLARDADLWIRVGMELEIGWEGPVLNGSRNPRIQPGRPGHLDASAEVIRLDVPDGPISRAMGDVHPSGNPHYWLDPYNARIVAGAVAGRLAELRPAQAPFFAANLAAFQRELDERMFGAGPVKARGGEALWPALLAGTLEEGAAGPGSWLAAMRPWRGRKIVTYHKSWLYFANRFGLVVAGELEPKPGIPPTASHLAGLAERMRADGVALILQEPFYSRKAADRLAGQTGARVVVAASSAGGAPGVDSLFEVFERLIGAITEP